MALITGFLVGKNHVYQDNTGMALTTSFKEVAFGFASVGIILANRETGAFIEYSFDGVTVHGKLLDTDTQPRVFMLKQANSIWLRGQSGGEEYNVEAWG